MSRAYEEGNGGEEKGGIPRLVWIISKTNGFDVNLQTVKIK